MASPKICVKLYFVFTKPISVHYLMCVCCMSIQTVLTQYTILPS